MSNELKISLLLAQLKQFKVKEFVRKGNNVDGKEKVVRVYADMTAVEYRKFITARNL